VLPRVLCLDGKLMLQENLQVQQNLEMLDESFGVQFAAFDGLVNRKIISKTELEKIVRESRGVAKPLEESLRKQGVPKHEILLCLSDHYRLPFLEFNESLPGPGEILERLDFEELKRDLWFPLSVGTAEARVAAFNPCDPELHDKIRGTLGVPSICFIVALPTDIIRMVEHSLDVNPGFPPAAGRTPLAQLRTRLASDRTALAWYRTSMAKGRTGLALIRTGVSFVAVSLTLLRILGIGYLTVMEAPLVLVGRSPTDVTANCDGSSV